MSISQVLLPEFDHEMASTRKYLARVPDAQPGFKPHAKSMPLGNLAHHLALLPTWANEALEKDRLDLAASGPRPALPATNAELLAAFDAHVAKARAALAAASDDLFLRPWSLAMGDKTFFTIPKIAVVRTWVLNHSIHHRGQLGVYLRLLEVPVPAIYGPTADETAF